MKNINRTYKNIFKKTTNFSSFLTTKLPKNKLNDFTNINTKLSEKSNIYLAKNEKSNTKNGILTIRNRPKNKRVSSSSNINREKEFSSQYPSNSRKSAIIQVLKKMNNEKSLINSKSSTQDNFNIFNIRKIPNVKLNFFKNLIENMSNHDNLKDIDYIIESPYRGVEKIQTCLSKKNYNKTKNDFYKSVNINRNNEKFFCKKRVNESIKSYSDISSLSLRKYNNSINDKKKEIDNPLEKISKLSGISCYKLRKAIDYSLRHNLKDLLKNKKEKEEEKINNDKINKLKTFFRTNRHKKIHWMISLKPKQNCKFENCINENTIEIHDEGTIENVIYSKKGICTRNH